MAATVEIDEANGAGETLTHGITNSNMGSADAVNLVAADYPVAPGANTYEKWQKIHVTAMGGSSKIDNLKVWRTTALGGSAVHVTNAREASYGGAETYAQPVATDSSVATEAMPTSEPSGANLGIGGALAGALTDVGSSDYLVDQIQVDAGDVAGASTTKHYQYDEVA
jgi:hypothetical protein